MAGGGAGSALIAVADQDFAIAGVNALLLQLVALALATFRGLDYLAGAAGQVGGAGRQGRGVAHGGLSLVEQALPLQVWGAAFLVAVVVCAVGIVARCWPLAVAGHAGQAGLYAALAIGVVAAGQLSGSWVGVAWLVAAAGFNVILADTSLDAWRARRVRRRWRRARG